MREYLLCALLLLPALAGADGITPSADVARVTAQLRAYYLTDGANPAALGLPATLTAEGAWPDVDYRSPQRANWPTTLHVNRILQMTQAWARPETPAETKATLAAAIHRALGYWAAHDFQCPNWWSNNIGVPQTLGTAALLLGDELHPDEYAYLTQTVLPRTKIGMTGQNRVWLAGNTLMAGLLRKDDATVANAAATIFSEVVVTDGEGIQPDDSFHQHGAQLQFGNYGLSFAGDIVKWAAILRGSPWALPPARLTIFRGYLLDGLRWTLWHGKMDISSCGRQLSPASPAAKGASVLRVMTAMTRVDPDHAADYAAVVRGNTPGGENPLVGCRVFPRSDYLLYRRPTFCASLKMCSKRTIGGESLNSENLAGYYLADGALYLYRTGDEYTDIFPAWNWRRIPGVTTPQHPGALPHFATIKETATFVGGVTDGTAACAIFDYARDGVTAKKAYFCAGDMLVCLGAGIRADAVADPIATTVNQCLLHGPVHLSGDVETRDMKEDARTGTDIHWIEHDGTRYTFPQGGTVTVQRGEQSGSWRTVLNVSGVPKAAQTRQVFTLYLDHGTHPADATYAYVISPAGAAPAVTLLANTTALQAVQLNGLLLTVFHAPGTVTAAGHTLAADHPCLLLLDLAAPHVTVADPTQQLPALTLTLDGKAVDITLPRGAHAGQSLLVKGF